jgi:hypothetical protein
MGFAGYVSVCVQLYCVGFHCLSLHVSVYMAIFRSVGALLCWFPLSFTTCFGLHGHLQVCMSFIVLVSTVFHYVSAIILYFNILLHCIVQWGFAGYVSICLQLYCVGFHGLSLHASVYMAIFKCVWALLCWFPLSFTTWFGHNTIF